MKALSVLLLASFLCTAVSAQTIRYVTQNGTGDGSSWALASPSLQAMINASASNDQVWVAAGTYRPTTGTNTAISFSMKDNVAIYGGFSGMETLLTQRDWLVNETILSGDIGVPNNNSDNSLHVFVNLILNSTAVLDGFTVRDGHAYNTSPDVGAAMYNYRASVTIRNCRFTANIAHLDGGAIFNYDCSPIITDCIFDGNSTVSGNGGGAIFNELSHPLITNCVFAGNYANPSGGAIHNIGHPVITNCVFIGNEAAVKGGAIYNLSSSANGTFINCSFAGNTAPSGGAIMNYGAANVTIKNCILWGNNSQIFNDLGSIPTVTYSLVQGGYTGTGNIDEDPLFVSQPSIGLGTTGDLRLLACSPAVDLGTNTGAPLTDHDGNVRPFNATGTATTDIGAFEFQSTFMVYPWYFDTDMDDYGSSVVFRCTPPVNAYALADLSGTGTDDCNGNDNTIYPGAPELCDSKDNDCDPGTNENPGCCPTVGTIFYVNPNATGAANGHSWEDAFTNLQYALVSTCPGITQIWVAAGTYKPTNGTDRSISFVMKNNVAIYGGFAGTETSLSERNWNANYTVLSGDIGEQEIHSDNSFHVVANSGLNSTAILDGFTITHGYSINFSSRGAGMYNVGSSPTIANCTFLSNGTPNTGSGGGMSNQANSSPTLTSCIFIGNLAEIGGGMFNDAGCSPTLNGCVFSGNSAFSGGGMYNYSGASIMNNCLFTAHSGVSGSAVYNFGGSPQFINCTYTGNNSGYAGTIFNESAATPIFKNCIIWGNNSAIADAGGSSSTVTYSIVQGGYAGTGNLSTDPLLAGSGLGLLECSPAIDAGTNSGAPLTDIIGNIRPFNATGSASAITDIGAFEYSVMVPVITCYADTDGDSYGNPDSSQVFCIACGEGFIIDSTDCNDMNPSDHPGGIEICDGFDNDCDGMIDEGSGNNPNVLFVKADANGLNDGTSWEDAYSSLQTALANTCPAYTQIWVAAGTYKPTTGTDRTISFAMKNAMAIYGGFNGTESDLNQRNWDLNVTILSGNIGQTSTIWDNSFHVVANTGLNPTAILDGFTIIDGTADGSNTNSKGGGMYNLQSSPTIVNCIFTFNVAYGSESGGGMFNENNSSPNISYCTFIENSGPFGGGIYNASGCNPQLNACVFNSNYGNYGGGMLNFFASPVLNNCLFIGHTAIYQAAAVLNFGGSTQFMNCTFTGNAGVVDGAIHNDAGATAVFQNCIVWGNASGISNSVTSSAEVNFSIVQGGYAGSGNINADPLFIGSGDFSLQECSPAIDAGTNTGAPLTDINDNTRPFNATGIAEATTDIGAYEFSALVPFVTCYADTDDDGYGDPDSTQVFCQSCGPGYVSNNADCDDDNPSQHPDETEICDGTDNDCDGLIDEGNVCCTPSSVLYVKADATGQNTGTSWVNAYTSLQSALNNTCPAISQIWVAAGTYKPTTTINRSISFVMENNLALYGGFAGTETLLSQRDWNANITILSGEIASLSVEDNSFHVISNFENGVNTTAVLDGFTITGGNANSGDYPDFFGGGMFNHSSAPTVSNCIFANNRARQGAGMLNHSADPVVSHVTFSNNIASLHGGGLYNVLANTIVNNCAFISNSAVTDGGGIQNFNCNPTITNCLIIGNSPSGITNLDLAQPVLTNCTVTSSAYGIRSFFNCIPQLKNCILWDNTTSVENSTGSSAAISYSIIQGGYGGTGNLDADPLFIGSGDMHLQPCSPAINAGTNAGAPTIDFDGNPRPFTAPGDPDPISDMGAYEYQSPVLVAACVSITAYLNTQENFTVLANDINGGSTGCGPLTSLINGESLWTFYCDDIGANIVTLTVIDVHGNTATCAATVTVVETMAPTAVCNNATVYLDASGNASVSASMIDNGSYDNCEIDTMSVSPNTFTCANIGSNSVTLTITDLGGNTASCSATVSVADNAPPTVLCQDVTISLTVDGIGSLSAAQINEGSYDNCGIASFSVSPNTLDCSDVGAHTAILTVTDVNGNSATGSANVTVQDITPPIAVCQDVTLHLDANGQAGFMNSEIVLYNYSCDLSEQPFANVSQAFVAASSGFITRIGAGIGTWATPTTYSTMISTVSNTINYGALQYSGRCCYSTCAPGNNMAFVDLPNAFYVNAGETVTISFSGSGGSVHYDNGQLRLYVTGITNGVAVLDGGSSDVCGMAGMSASHETFTCTDVGENVVTLTFTDVHGNSSTCSAIVTIVDTIAPIALSQNVTVYLDEDGNASVSGAQLDNGSHDNCDIETLSVSPNVFTCADVGANMVTFTVIDANGNSATQSAAVTVMAPLGPHRWLGAVSADWGNPLNWSRCYVPTAVDEVLIEAKPIHPVIGSMTNAVARLVEMKDNMILTLQGTLTVTED